MRILFWVPYPTEGASNRYRVEQYLPYLKKAGIKYSLRPFWNSRAYKILYKNGRHIQKIFFFIRGTILRLFDLLAIYRYDIIFIHRESYPVGPAFFEAIISILKKPIIFDFDDAIFLPAPSRPNAFIERFKRPDKIAHIIKMSRHVIVFNSHLADFALRYNRNVTIIPTPINMDTFCPDNAGRGDNNKVVIGWIGSVTSQPLLNDLKDVFRRISKKFPNVVFKIVGGEFFVEGLSNIVNKPWSLNEEIEDIRSFDIGIMPMPTMEWAKAKGFKAILYTAMGIPCVCPPIGMNTEVISDGLNGFLVSTDDEWVEKLSLLIESPALREKQGQAGIKIARERYSLRANAPKFIEVLKGAVS